MDASRTYAVNWLNQYSVIPASDAGLQTSGFEPQYDDDGNQTLIQTSTGVWSVTYNGENRPVLWERITSDSNTQNSNTQTIISMSFDRMGRRVSYLETCSSTTNAHKVFTYDGYLQIANSELTTQTSQLFIWDPTEPVATRPLAFYDSNASPQYYTHDGNKNVSDITDATQSLSAHYSYTPFGALLSCSGSSSPSNPFRFSSEYSDDALGLVYYNYRHYNPEIGRWMQRDFQEEFSLLLYAYLGNEPVQINDYLGVAKCNECCQIRNIHLSPLVLKNFSVRTGVDMEIVSVPLDIETVAEKYTKKKLEEYIFRHAENSLLAYAIKRGSAAKTRTLALASFVSSVGLAFFDMRIVAERKIAFEKRCRSMRDSELCADWSPWKQVVETREIIITPRGSVTEDLYIGSKISTEFFMKASNSRKMQFYKVMAKKILPEAKKSEESIVQSSKALRGKKSRS